MTVVISAIAAMSRNHVIGRDNKIPWHISEDFKFFKRTTMGKPMIVGRKTFESFGKPLPGRPHVVISRTSQTDRPDENVFFVQDIDAALIRAKEIAVSSGVDEICIVGGAQIYKQAFTQTQRFYLTLVGRDYDGDAFLDLDFTGWKEVSSQSFDGDPPYTIKVLERR
jgi:dihydrofolate reductase